jgi:hypothetical protein
MLNKRMRASIYDSGGIVRAAANRAQANRYAGLSGVSVEVRWIVENYEEVIALCA